MARDPLLVRIMVDLLHHPQIRGESSHALVRRWLVESEVGRRFDTYLADEAEILLMAANRLNISGDEDLREISVELARIAKRLEVLRGPLSHRGPGIS
jgi:hypothetical protein